MLIWFGFMRAGLKKAWCGVSCRLDLTRSELMGADA